MAAKVVDASALAALLFNEPEAAGIVDRLAEGRLVAPTLLDYELANVCLVKLRRHPAQSEQLTAAFGLRTRLDLETLAVDPAGVLALARSTGLTAYDASYLWLARTLGVELVTLDGQLAKAAARA